ncbi:MAG: FAD synthetase family protein [Verrucomicrobia bacterium]|nr:FAD synthetase family protein [Verrucomicrobiota bacterium]
MIHLSIGTFDGVHLGHQHLFSQLPKEGKRIAFTFTNHPSSYFSHRAPVPLICTLPHKLKLLKSAGMDEVIAVPFDASFAEQTYRAFLTYLKERTGFTHLVLGTGATFGKNREGDEAHVRMLTQELSFQVDYLPKFLKMGQPISSGRIRPLIQEAAFSEVEQLLGRPYSILATPTQNHFDLPELCLPKPGSYKVTIQGSSTIAHISSRSLSLDSPVPDGTPIEIIF